MSQRTEERKYATPRGGVVEWRVMSGVHPFTHEPKDVNGYCPVNTYRHIIPLDSGAALALTEDRCRASYSAPHRHSESSPMHSGAGMFWGRSSGLRW